MRLIGHAVIDGVHDVMEQTANGRELDFTERLAKAALAVVIVLGAAEQVGYRWGRAHHTAHRWWADVEHRGRDDLLRTVAGLLAPVAGRPRP